MAYTWPYAILLPWRGPCAYTPLSLSNMRATSVASAPPSTDFQIAISTIGPFLSRVSMFPHSLLLPSFWFIKPSLLPYFLFPKLCLFFKTSCHILPTCTWNQSESCHHKNIDALNVCTFACALALKIRYDYTFHNAPTFGGDSSHRAESASNLIYTLNRILVRSVVDGCRMMCMPICHSAYLILFQIFNRFANLFTLSYFKFSTEIMPSHVPSFISQTWISSMRSYCATILSICTSQYAFHLPPYFIRWLAPIKISASVFFYWKLPWSVLQNTPTSRLQSQCFRKQTSISEFNNFVPSPLQRKLSDWVISITLHRH